MNILITGTSSGLGHELAKQFAERGDTVYGISRTSSGLNIKQAQCNLLDLQELPIVLNKLIDTDQIDTVICVVFSAIVLQIRSFASGLNIFVQF